MFKKILSAFGLIQITEAQAQALIQADQMKGRIEELEKDNQVLTEFFDTAFTYFQGNPNWKAQQEFRELVSNDQTLHADALDDYLGRLVDATRKCLVARKMKMDKIWEDESLLSAARGHRGWKRLFPEENTAQDQTT